MKKILVLSLLIIGNSLLDSCTPDETFGFTLDLTGVSHFSMATYSTPVQGTGIAANDYALLVEGSSLLLSTMPGPSFGGNLMADAAYALKDPVSLISITSNADLNINYPAGSELKLLFVPLEIASHCVGNPGAANDCVYDYSSVNSIEQAFNQEMAVGFVERGGAGGGARIFALKTEEVIISQSHVFTIRFDFQSGKSTELITEAVTFE